DPERQVDAWAHGFLAADGPTGTNDLLIAMTRAIHDGFTYHARSDGMRVPVETLARRAGTCRDFALLMIEAVRSLGLPHK
ncbi:MAG: transglutaminase family protein, partial [Kiloniellaceae bacterium]